MPKFRERPKEIEAILWDGTDEALAAVERLTGQTDLALGLSDSLAADGPEGPSVVRLGWWIVKDGAGVRGYPPERFAKRYEAMSDPDGVSEAMIEAGARALACQPWDTVASNFKARLRAQARLCIEAALAVHEQ
jgi:hypothetical protein